MQVERQEQFRFLLVTDWTPSNQNYGYLAKSYLGSRA